MYLLQLIYMIALIAVAHIFGTEVLDLNPDLGFGSTFDIYMFSVLLVGFIIPIVLPAFLDCATSFKTELLAKTKLSNGMATFLGILLTILFPIIGTIVLLAAIVGAHMLLSWLLGIFKK